MSWPPLCDKAICGCIRLCMCVCVSVCQRRISCMEKFSFGKKRHQNIWFIVVLNGKGIQTKCVRLHKHTDQNNNNTYTMNCDNRPSRCVCGVFLFTLRKYLFTRTMHSYLWIIIVSSLTRHKVDWIIVLAECHESAGMPVIRNPIYIRQLDIHTCHALVHAYVNPNELPAPCTHSTECYQRNSRCGTRNKKILRCFWLLCAFFAFLPFLRFHPGAPSILPRGAINFICRKYISAIILYVYAGARSKCKYGGVPTYKKWQKKRKPKVKMSECVTAYISVHSLLNTKCIYIFIGWVLLAPSRIHTSQRCAMKMLSSHNRNGFNSVGWRREDVRMTDNCTQPCMCECVCVCYGEDFFLWQP